MVTVPPEYEFTCPECLFTTRVDDGARKLLIDDGCLDCEVSVGAGNFHPV